MPVSERVESRGLPRASVVPSSRVRLLLTWRARLYAGPDNLSARAATRDRARPEAAATRRAAFGSRERFTARRVLSSTRMARDRRGQLDALLDVELVLPRADGARPDA